MAEMAFAIFDHIERRDERVGELYEGLLRLLEAADAAGFRYHLAEHHATPLGMAPSPGIFLAAAAGGSNAGARVARAWGSATGAWKQW